jgi:hypothetical protein
MNSLRSITTSLTLIAVAVACVAQTKINPATQINWPGVNTQTGTTYTIAASDIQKLLTFNNASAVAVTLPQATGSFAKGAAFHVTNLGAGTVTITPTTSTINGASSLALTQNQGAFIVSDGTNYSAQLTGAGSSGSVNGQISASFAGVPANGQLLALVPITFSSFVVPSGCTGSKLGGKAAATASTTFTLYYLAGGPTATPTSFGTAVVSASGNSATFTCSSGHTFSAGDYLEIDGPATADATFGNIGASIAGTHP